MEKSPGYICPGSMVEVTPEAIRSTNTIRRYIRELLPPVRSDANM
jgi:hypothetical protein